MINVYSSLTIECEENGDIENMRDRCNGLEWKKGNKICSFFVVR